MNSRPYGSGTQRADVQVLVWLIRAYQLAISPFLGRHCRFHPSCSAYAAEALVEHGLVRGVWLALKRVARCHPWNPGGNDPVPHRSYTCGVETD